MMKMCIYDEYKNNVLWKSTFLSITIQDKTVWFHRFLFVTGYSKDGQKAVNKYRESGRYETCKETEAVVKAKYQ